MIFFKIGLDGWTDPCGKSLWNFVIHTSSGREYLWKLVDLSNQSHTGETLQDCIQQIFDELGVHKFGAIVTDGGSNCTVAQQLISEQYPHILNL